MNLISSRLVLASPTALVGLMNECRPLYLDKLQSRIGRSIFAQAIFTIGRVNENVTFLYNNYFVVKIEEK